MESLKKSFVIACVALCISLGINIYFGVKVVFPKPAERLQGANSQFGMPCIYTTGTRALGDGTGTAFSCDDQGRLILSN